MSFDELLRQSDFVVVTCAMNKETQGIFDEAAFAKMKNSAIIVNGARGGKTKRRKEKKSVIVFHAFFIIFVYVRLGF